MKITTCVAMCVVLTCLATSASAAVITPVGVSSTTSGRANYSINGGPNFDDSDPDVLNWTASPSWANNTYETYDYANPTLEVLTFDLGSIYDLTNIYLWNYSHEGNIPGRQITSFDYEVSSDNITWSAPVNTGAFAAAANTTAPQTTTNIAIAETNVRYIRFSNWTTVSDPLYMGFNEVRFGEGAVPEPSSFALAAFGLAGLGWFGYRRRSR